MASCFTLRYSFPMNVVIATPFYPPERGVLATYAEGLAGAFEKRGDHVVLVPFGDTKRLPPGVRHLAYFSRLLMMAPGASFVLALDTWSVGIPALLAAKIRHVPFVVRIGGDYLWESYTERTKENVLFSEFYTQRRSFSLKERLIFFASRFLLRNADVVFFNTKFQKKIWEDAYGFPTKKSHVLENFYPEKVMHAATGKVFVSAGRDRFFKNFATLERAFAKVRMRNPGIELDTRSLPHDEHLARLNAAYAVIIPAISEVGSNTVIDGVTRGKPFIMTNDTGTKERLLDCGFFTDTRSEEQLAAAIESLLDSAIYERLVGTIRAFDFTHSWDEIVEEIRKRV